MNVNKIKWFKLVNGDPRCKLCNYFYSKVIANKNDKCPNCGHSTKDEQEIKKKSEVGSNG